MAPHRRAAETEAEAPAKPKRASRAKKAAADPAADGASTTEEILAEATPATEEVSS